VPLGSLHALLPLLSSTSRRLDNHSFLLVTGSYTPVKRAERKSAKVVARRGDGSDAARRARQARARLAQRVGKPVPHRAASRTRRGRCVRPFGRWLLTTLILWDIYRSTIGVEGVGRLLAIFGGRFEEREHVIRCGRYSSMSMNVSMHHNPLRPGYYGSGTKVLRVLCGSDRVVLGNATCNRWRERGWERGAQDDEQRWRVGEGLRRNERRVAGNEYRAGQADRTVGVRA
jgi:hypothetical protein